MVKAASSELKADSDLRLSTKTPPHDDLSEFELYSFTQFYGYSTLPTFSLLEPAILVKSFPPFTSFCNYLARNVDLSMNSPERDGQQEVLFEETLHHPFRCYIFG